MFAVFTESQTYDAELEHMNDALSSENHGLLHDNKHIGGLIKEYEQTLETLMSTFRNRAREVQDRELSIVKEHETRLLALEEENSRHELEHETKTSESISRLSHLLRQCMRLHSGEDPLDSTPQTMPASLSSDMSASSSHEGISSRPAPLSPRLTAREVEEHPGEDVALDRECELARLEKENEELRRMLGLLPAKMRHPRLGSSGFNDRFGAYARESSAQRLSVETSSPVGY